MRKWRGSPRREPAARETYLILTVSFSAAGSTFSGFRRERHGCVADALRGHGRDRGAGASGCSSGGARYVTPLTVTPPEPAADQRWSFSVASCTTTFCPTLYRHRSRKRGHEYRREFRRLRGRRWFARICRSRVLLAEGEAVAVCVRFDGVGPAKRRNWLLMCHTQRGHWLPPRRSRKSLRIAEARSAQEKPAMVWSVPQISGQSGQAVARVLPGIGTSTLRDPTAVVSVRAGRWHSTERSGYGIEQAIGAADLGGWAGIDDRARHIRCCAGERLLGA